MSGNLTTDTAGDVDADPSDGPITLMAAKSFAARKTALGAVGAPSRINLRSCVPARLRTSRGKTDLTGSHVSLPTGESHGKVPARLIFDRLPVPDFTRVVGARSMSH